MSGHLRAVADSGVFQRIILGTILFAGVLVGLETYPEVVARHGGVLHALDQLVLAIFVVEIVIKMGAEGSRPWRYFADGWNVFDFVIVAVCFLPLDAHYVTVLRLARLLRVLKLVRSLPRLQLLVGALLRSLPSMGYVALLLFVLFYVYAVAATFLFGPADPIHFGTLELSLLSLFQIVTLEGWVELMELQMDAHPVIAVAFFISFILLGTMVMLNLFIGVIMSGMAEAAADRDADERDARRGGAPTLADELAVLTTQLQAMQRQVEQVRRRGAKQAEVEPSTRAAG